MSNWIKSRKYACVLFFTLVLAAGGLTLFVTGSGRHEAEGALSEKTENDYIGIRKYDREQPFEPEEDFQRLNPGAQPHAFEPLQPVKAKLIRGFQLTIPVQDAQIAGRYVSRDKSRLLYLIRRTFGENGGQWNRVDGVWFDSKEGTYGTFPLSYTYGKGSGPNGPVPIVLDFSEQGELLLIGARTAGDRLVYSVFRYRIPDQKMSAVMDAGAVRASEGDGTWLASAWRAPGGDLLLLEDNHQVIRAYSMADGSRHFEFIPPAESRESGRYVPSPDKSSLLYVTEPHKGDAVWLVNADQGTSSRPFAHEPGWIDPGFDASGKLIYDNFAYDRSENDLLGSGKNALLLAKGVQISDLRGDPVQRFAIAGGTEEYLEFAGYAEDRHKVLLHKYRVETGKDGSWKKHTADWLAGDLSTGEMVSLERLNVPDHWDRGDVYQASVVMDSTSGLLHCFVNIADGTYFVPRWKNREMEQEKQKDRILYDDETNKRVYSRSFTRPDLGVAVMNYKKYGFGDGDFVWLEGGYLSRAQTVSGRIKLYFFRVSG